MVFNKVKNIELQIRNRITIPAGATVNLTAGLDLIKEVQKKGDFICRSAVSLEGLMEDVLNWYFLPDEKSRKSLLASAVFGSSSFTFSEKRRLILLIAKEEKIITGKGYSDFEKCSRRVISLRNAFTHGTITTDGEKIYLIYFEGTEKSREINDDYLTEIEHIFKTTWEYLEDIVFELGLLKRPTE